MPVPVLQPALLPDETIYGYLQRLAIVGHDRAMKPLVRSVLPIKGIQAPWLLPSHLVQLARVLHALPDAQTLLTEHTIFPAVVPFISTDNEERLRASMLNGIGVPNGLYFTLGLMHSLAYSRQMHQTFCADCVAEDIATYGVAYWKRFHQFPYISTCGIHGTILRAGSACCNMTRRVSPYARLPDRFCQCSTPTQPVLDLRQTHIQVKKDRLISAILFNALNFDWPTFDSRALGALYRLSTIEKGFVKGRYVATPTFARDFEDYYSREFLERYASLSVPSTGWVAEAARGKPPKSVVRNALLIQYMFGDLAQFAARIKEANWRACTTPPRQQKIGDLVDSTFLPPPISAGTRATMRQALTQWLAANQAPSRSAVLRDLPKEVRWLREHDATWYSKQIPDIPRAIGVDAQTKRWMEAKEVAELRAIAHVEQRHQFLTRPGIRPQQITRRRLADGLPMPLSGLPKAAKVVNNLLDTRDGFNERLAVWLVNNPPKNSDPDTALEYAYQKTRLPKGRIQRLVDLSIVGTVLKGDSGLVCPSLPESK
jgi:hypothetical protein